MMNTVLTIAGSDTCAGAGIQADIKTCAANETYAYSVITALTAQNTLGIKSVFEVPDDFFDAQIDSVFEDVFPDAVKIGMLCSEKKVCSVYEKLTFYKAKNIVIDPVLVSTSGKRLLSQNAEKNLKENLFPIATLVTPNIPEIETILCCAIKSDKDIENAAEQFFKIYKSAVLIKGGHKADSPDDYLFDGIIGLWLKGEKIENNNTHGTGCTLSSAIASNLAKGFDLQTAVRKSKQYITLAIKDGLDIGKGRGPLNHMFMLKNINNKTGDYSK